MSDNEQVRSILLYIYYLKLKYTHTHTHIFKMHLVCGEGAQVWYPCGAQKTTFWGVGSLILLCELPASNLGQQAWQQTPLSPEPSRQL